MEELVDFLGFLLSLYELNVGFHSVLLVLSGEDLRDEGVLMESGEGDELPDESHGGESGDELQQVILSHAMSVPVEGGGQVVGEHGMGALSVDDFVELVGILEAGAVGFHPDHVGVFGELEGSLSAVFDGAFDSIESFFSSAGIPVEVEVESVLLGELLGLPEGGDFADLLPFSQELLLLGLSDLSLDGEGSNFGESEELAGIILIVLSENEGVVELVDVVVEESGSLGVGSSNNHESTVHNVGLESGCLESADHLSNRYEHLSSEMTALLDTDLLVLDVDSSNSGFNEGLGELHHAGHSSESSISISDDGDEVVDLLGLEEFHLAHLGSLPVLLSVVEHEGLGELVDLVGDGVHGVVSEIWSGFIHVGDVSGRALPSRNVDGGQVFGLVGGLDGVESSISVAGFSLGILLSKHVVEFG